MKQRTVSTCRSGSVTFWAWMASIGTHLTVLTIFGVVRFSHLQAVNEQRPAPTTKISRVEKFIQTSPVIPKPRVKRLVRENITERDGTKPPERLAPPNPTFNAPKPVTQDLPTSFSPASSVGKDRSSIEGVNPPNEIEFFGSRTQERKVCYVVDSSGSMQGMFGRVRDNLKKSIEALQPDQYFYIIFFGGKELLEFGDGRLLRAAPKAKSAAYSFIDSVQAVGRTNALAALEKAIQVRDGSGNGPAVIYFLTDGFELTTEDTRRFPQRISNLLREISPRTKINVIGFWPAESDRNILGTIAAQSGGEFVLVYDDNS
jgi:hypothetical protein